MGEEIVRNEAVHIHTRFARKVKVTNEAGEVVGEATSADVLASLLKDADIEFLPAVDGVELARDRAIEKRRKAGLADLCEAPECGAELSNARSVVAARNKKPHPWFCPTCSDPNKRRLAQVNAYQDRISGKVVDACISCSRALGSTPGSIRERLKKAGPWYCSPCSRRRIGTPIEQHYCDGIGCGKPLGNAYVSVRRRVRLGRPWYCKRCSINGGGDLPVDTHQCAECDCALSMDESAVRRRKKVGPPYRCHACAAAKGGRRDGLEKVKNYRKPAPLPPRPNCERCSEPLPMSANARRIRSKMPRPWLCAGCRSDDAVKARRGAIPQELCSVGGCGRALAMTYGAVKERAKRTGPHMCPSCAAREKSWAKRRAGGDHFNAEASPSIESNAPRTS